jgi:hypothetical protein
MIYYFIYEFLFLIICILFVGHGKMNFGFDESDTEPSTVDLLAKKSGGKNLDKPRTKASSSLLEKRTRTIEVAVDDRSKKIREKGPVWIQKLQLSDPHY